MKLTLTSKHNVYFNVFLPELYFYTCLFVLQKLVLDIKWKKEANNSSWHLNASAMIIINTIFHFSRVTGN